MTSEEFQSRYRLLTQVTDGEVRTYHAIAPSGSVVMAHFLDPDARDQPRQLLALIESLSPPAKERVLKVTEVDGAPVVVTRFILEFETLPQWLRANAVATEPVAGPDTAEIREESEIPEEADIPGEAEIPEETERLEEPESEELRSPPAGAGEFTQLFRIPQVDPPLIPEPEASEADPAADPAAEKAQADVEPQPAEEAKASSGEFTQLFRRPPLEEPTESTPSSPPPAGAGDTQEFAGLFRTGAEESTPSAESAPAAEASPTTEPHDLADTGISQPSEPRDGTAAPRPDPVAPLAPEGSPPVPPAAEPGRVTLPLPEGERPSAESRPPGSGVWPQDKPAAAEFPPALAGEDATADAQSAKEPGELTRLFQRAEPPERARASPPPSDLFAPAEPEPFSPSPSEPEMRPPPPKVDYSEDYLDRLQGSTPPKQPAPWPAAAPLNRATPSLGLAGGAHTDRSPTAPPSPPVRGPSEYTQVISAQSAPFPVEPRPPVAAPRPAPLPPRRGPSRFLLLFGLGFIFVAAMALVLYFVLTT